MDNCRNCNYHKCIICEEKGNYDKHYKHTSYCSYSCEDYFYHENKMAKFNEKDENKFFEIFKYPKNHVSQGPNYFFLIRQTVNNFDYYYYVKTQYNISDKNNISEKNIIVIGNIINLHPDKKKLINRELKNPLSIVFNEEDLINYIFDCDIKKKIKEYNMWYTLIDGVDFYQCKYKNLYYLPKYKDVIYKMENTYIKGKLKEKNMSGRYTKAAIKK